MELTYQSELLQLSEWKRYFINHGLPAPDVIFDACLLDPRYREEQQIKLPLPSESRSNGQLSKGCYLFFDGTTGVKPFYAGKAARLRNRLGQHWSGHRSSPMDHWPWLADDPINDWTNPFVAVWLTSNNVAFEQQLIDVLSPLLNQRRE